MSEIAHYIMIGGFLGAGKTTAVARLAQELTDQGQRVGLICNDQSSGLVDTTLLRAKGFSVEEITGGCFCCRFNSLLEAAENLTQASRPDLFLAEPVGSCTDLIATVSYPLRRIYGERFTVAPLSVMIDPLRAARILGLAEGRSFSEKVVYVYQKQLQEADFIVVNKCDAHPPGFIKQLESALKDLFPNARTFICSAHNGTGTRAWFDAMLSDESPNSTALKIDYDIYAEGEALLGWLNCTARLESNTPFDGNQTLIELAGKIRDGVIQAGQDIAHLKMTLDSQDGTGTLSVVSLVGVDREPDLRESLLDRVDGGELVVNLRAEANPAQLETVTRQALASLGNIRAVIEHLEQLRPGRPTPTHRMAE
ncbi:MAG: GTP-binding protein [Acidobacteriota bacterium]|nr:GTP-binding protein [Acidobacteriota bacterium]